MSGRVISSKQSDALLPSWPGRSHVTIFVRCLHLLDLDLLEDWPGVTDHMFTAKVAQQNLQQRVKAVEWCLYRLFELYDPTETRDKLRPFFPPTTQLQSLDLRAALYRCLTELKKIGVLGKDVLLRKTMLDECKGERFEEVVASFAMITLHKASLLAKEIHKNPVPDTHLLPIILATRVSLQRNLNIRQEEDVRVKRDLEQLSVANTTIQQGLETRKSASAVLDKDKQERLRNFINAHWIGDTVWSDILLQGDPVEGIVNDEESSKRTFRTSQPQVLLRDLDDRIEKHRRRLAGWKVVAKDLMAKQKPLADSRPLTQSRDEIESLRFVQHKSLNLEDRTGPPSTEVLMDTSYMDLMNLLRHEFEAPAMKKMSSQNKSTLSSPPEPSVDQHIETKTTVLPENSGQQQPIAELSSLVNRSVASGNDEGSILADDYKTRSISSSPPQSSIGDSPWVPSPQVSAATLESNHNTPVGRSTPPDDIVPEPPVSPSKLWMSLADRTRASMSLNSRSSILSDPDSPISSETKQTKVSMLQDPNQSSDDDRYATLVERTRKSMSMFSNSSAVRPRKAGLNKRISQSFPINQFETPGRPQRPVEQTRGSGVSTPPDNLFDEEAEYTSIFKSRPKLALSPAFSPERRASGLGSIIEQDMERLNLASDDNVD